MTLGTGSLLLGAGDTGYNLTRSLRVRASASAYLSRTPVSGGNRKTFTYRTVVKRGALSGAAFFALLDAQPDASNWLTFWFANDAIGYDVSVAGTRIILSTSARWRDPANFYDIELRVDTTLATAADRIRIYINGNQVTLDNYTAGSGYVAQNADLAIGTVTGHSIGRRGTGTPDSYFDGYLADTYLIVGQSLPPTSFGSINPTTGSWSVGAYTGSFGSYDSKLSFTDNSALTTSSNVGLGKDFSGNGNYWVTNNISITAGVTYDSMTDVPTLTSTTAANYCVLSPIDNSSNGVQVVLSGGNLDLSLGSGQGRATFSVSSGKWYWEIVSGATNQGMYGIIKQSVPIASATFASADGYFYWASNGNKYNNGSGTAYGTSLTSGDILGVAFDATAGTLTYYKNNVSLGTAFTGLSGTFSPAFCQGNTSATASFNFGQRPFAYTPPSGFVALNAYNITEGSITTSGSFVGNVNADGPSIYLNGVPTAMTINGNAVTFGTHADKTAYGFKLRSPSTSYNSTGTNTYSITTTGAKFKYANAQGNP